MALTRSQVTGQLPQPQWGDDPSNRRRAAAAATEAAVANPNADRNSEAVVNTNRNSKAAVTNANANRNSEAAVANANANRNLEAAAANADVNPNPHKRNPPHEVWMGIQACGVPNESKAWNIARNLFMNNFARCPKITKDDIVGAFKSPEKRLENDITVEPHVKNAVLAFHHWVKTCFWLNVDPEMVPFPVNDANAILKKSEAHN